MGPLIGCAPGPRSVTRCSTAFSASGISAFGHAGQPQPLQSARNHRLDAHAIAGRDPQHRRHARVVVPPVHRLGLERQLVDTRRLGDGRTADNCKRQAQHHHDSTRHFAAPPRADLRVQERDRHAAVLEHAIVERLEVELAPIVCSRLVARRADLQHRRSCTTVAWPG